MKRIITCYSLDSHEQQVLRRDYLQAVTEEFLGTRDFQKIAAQIEQNTQSEFIALLDALPQKNYAELQKLISAGSPADAGLIRLLYRFGAQLVKREQMLSAESRVRLMERLTPYLSKNPEFDGMLMPLLDGLRAASAEEHAEKSDKPKKQPENLKLSPGSAASGGAQKKSAAIRTIPQKDFTMMAAIAAGNSRILSFGPVGEKIQSMLIVQKDGTVFPVGGDAEIVRCIKGWRSIREITAGTDSIAGVHYNGTLEFYGNASLWMKCKRWPALLHAAFSNEHLMGITVMGKPCSTYPFPIPLHPEQDARSILVIPEGYLILLRDGTVLGESAAGAGEWEQIISIAAGERHFIGLTRQGNVLSCGNNLAGQCRTGGWNNIIAIAASGKISAGLTSGGSIVTTDPALSKKVSGWHDVTGFTMRSGQIMAVTNSGKILSTCMGAAAFAGCQPNYTVIPR